MLLHNGTATAQDYRDLLLRIVQLDVPTLAIVQGPAFAGGFGLVLACDLVLVSSKAQFALPEPKRGISPAVVSPLLIHRVGFGAAMPILLTGQVVTADEAHRLHLCHYRVRPESLESARAEVTASILAGGPEALAMTKRLVRHFAESTLPRGRSQAGRKVSALCARHAEAREGLNAFLDKREPSWSQPRNGA